MSYIFRVSGFNFEVDEFLKQSNLTPYSAWHRGERKSSKRVHERSGFSMAASEADMRDPRQQIEDAIRFLNADNEDLKKLQKFPGAETLCLDFGIEDRDVAVQCDFLPPELLRLAGNLDIGIEITRYPTTDK